MYKLRYGLCKVLQSHNVKWRHRSSKLTELKEARDTTDGARRLIASLRFLVQLFRAVAYLYAQTPVRGG